MKKYIILSFAIIGLIMAGCKKEPDADTPINFNVYGTVFDRTTGEPVRGAKVSLYYGVHSSGVGSSHSNGISGSSVSGTDGQYSFSCIATQNLINTNNHIYTIEATCYGHNTYSERVTIMEAEGANIQIDILLY